MSTPRSTVFLERQTYRRRRLIDWIRILPIIGLILFLVPLLWPVDGSKATSSADALVYIFLVWFVLVIAAGVSARALKNAEEDDDDRDASGAEDV